MDIQLIDNGRIGYLPALAMQQQIFETALELKRTSSAVPHTLIFNEHDPVITLGKHADHANVLLTEERLRALGVELIQTNRGGDVTYHGPGQWTVYPIFDLEELGIGIRQYVHQLEEVALRTLAHYGLEGARIGGASGVWMHVDERPLKVCAIGIHASRFVTMHGIAFNVHTSPDAFSLINPCGFTDKGVTNLSQELGRDVTMEEAQDVLVASFAEVFGRTVHRQ